MSRLYIINESDISTMGKRCKTLASTSVNWGSTGDSKLAAEILVSWPKDAKTPVVTITIGKGIKDFRIKEGT